jgi:exonuclease SbcD
VRYSGTPLAYSYSETQSKEVVIIDLDAAGAASVTAIPVGVGRAVCTINGTMAELLDPARHPDAVHKFVRAHVTDRETVLDAKARLAQLYPHITEVKLMPKGEGGVIDEAPVHINELAPIDATREFWEAAEGSAPTDAIDQILVDAVEAATREVSA